MKYRSLLLSTLISVFVLSSSSLGALSKESSPSQDLNSPLFGPPTDSTLLSYDLNTMLMHSTFQLVGPSRPLLAGLSGIVSGTGFVLAWPKPNSQTKECRLLLITAAHVFEDIWGDLVCLRYRSQRPDGWQAVDIPVYIRHNGKPLWTQHPRADVAVIDLLQHVDESSRTKIRQEIRVLIDVSELASDTKLAELEIHPGDDLLCLGYPLNLSANPEGFPLLRGGRLASYPLLPTSTYNTFLFDFEVFSGNSGGPVYFVHQARTTSKGMHVGIDQTIVGLLSQQQNQQGESLKMGVVTPSSFIIETVSRLISSQ